MAESSPFDAPGVQRFFSQDVDMGVPGLISDDSSADVEGESEEIEEQTKEEFDRAKKRLRRHPPLNMDALPINMSNTISANRSNTFQQAQAPASYRSNTKNGMRWESDTGRIVWFPRRWPDQLSRVLLYKVQMGNTKVLKYLRFVEKNFEDGQPWEVLNVKIPISRLFDSSLYAEAVSGPFNKP